MEKIFTRNLLQVIVYIEMTSAIPLRHFCTGVHTPGSPVTPVSIPVRVGPEMRTPDEEVQLQLAAEFRVQ